MIIRKNKSDGAAFNSNSLFSAEELEGIELNGGDDDFGDEMLLRGTGNGSKANDHRS
jgi:hypothetical protein